MKILIVDDHHDGLTILSMLVRSMGHDVQSCNDSRGCLRVAKDFEPQLVMLDLGMHGLSGFDLAPQFRELPFPFVLAAVTGHVEPQYRARCEAAGFDFFVPKPATIEDLKALLEATESRLLKSSVGQQ